MIFDGHSTAISAAGRLPRPGVWEVAAIAALVALYIPVLPVMYHVWNRPDYSHGFIVPFAAAYLAWLERDRLRAACIRPREVAGLAVVVLGVALLLLSRAGAVGMLQIASVPVVLTGAVLAVYGTAVLRILLLPLGYLLFMVPFLDLVMSRLHPPLQMISAVIAAKILALSGLPVHREGLFLELPKVTLQVADECSGLRYLVSLLAVGLPLAWYTQRRTVYRVAFLAICAAIGVLTNGLRIAFIGIYNHVLGGEIHGPGHVFQGVFVSMVGYVFVGLAAWLLQLLVAEGPTVPATLASPASPSGHSSRRAWQAMTLIFGAAVLSALLVPGRIVPLAQSLATLPFSIGSWEGRVLEPGELTPELKPAVFDLQRRYSTGQGFETVLLVRYLASQSQGRELVFYTLQRLYDSGEDVKVVDAAGRTFTAIRTVFFDRVSKRHVAALYWHEIDGEGVGDRYRAKVRTALGKLLRGRTNGALVVVLADAESPGAAAALLPRLAGFAGEVRPRIVALLPRARG